MLNLTEFFGVSSADIFEQQEAAEGYLEGTKNAADVHRLINQAYKNRSRAFREALLQALREQL